MNWEEFLVQYKPKTITADTIKESFQLHSQVELKAFLDSLQVKGYLQPVGKDMTYQCPQVSKKYRVVREENNDLIAEMNYFYHVAMNFDYYKRHVEDYKRDKVYLTQLSEYLKQGRQAEGMTMSLNERSVQIFGNEKFMGSKEGVTLLSRLRMQAEQFSIYRTPEPFFYYYNPSSLAENVLIIENKDTWYTMRQLLREKKLICGREFCAVLYGEGRKIQQSFRDIDFCEYQPFNNVYYTFYYFGDIDRTGIDILVKLVEDNKGYQIRPFERAYQFLLDHVEKKRAKKEEEKITLSIEKVSRLFANLPGQELEKLLSICAAGELLPQELLNNEILRGENF